MWSKGPFVAAKEPPASVLSAWGHGTAANNEDVVLAPVDAVKELPTSVLFGLRAMT